MKHLELEKELTARMRKRRIIQACVILFFVAVAIIFNVIYENSEVVEKDRFGAERVTQNADWYSGVAIGIVGAIYTAVSLIIDFCCSKYRTFQVGDDHLTLYYGLFVTELYVNGECNGTIHGDRYLEARLSDRSKVTVSLGKWSSHMSFSNGRPPIDL